MIVAVESNFVLELTYRQEEAQDADGIIALAEARRIELVIPACCLFEPYETLIRRRKDNNALLGSLQTKLRQLARCEPYADLLDSSERVTRALADSGDIHAQSLSETVMRIARVANVLALTTEVIQAAIDAEALFQLSPQDAVVFASINRYFSQRRSVTKVFANKNRHDFFGSELRAHFRQYDCKLLSGFAATRQFIEAALGLAVYRQDAG